MLLDPIAHSKRLEKNIPAQLYSDHIKGVVSRANMAAETAAYYATVDNNLLLEVVRYASEFHDLGKLDIRNQEVLSGKCKVKKLPVQHTDAGTSYLFNEINNILGAVLIRSHHIGLPDFIEEAKRKEESIFRDDSIRKYVDRTLRQLIKKHKESELNLPIILNHNQGIKGDSSIFFRVALSCLVDGDHTDTAIHYGEYNIREEHINLCASERLAALDTYIGGLQDTNERSQFRTDVYNSCRNVDIKTNIASCNSPVGTGKTTAIMAHLLTQAKKRNIRRIIVVLPFTNIITQSVEVYRKALVLPGENPQEVVAEIHHRADFKDINTRHLTALWKTPIIVTTAVAFFETLASNSTSTLRRLHNLPGSAIFVDESHAALPAKLLPLAWRWMKIYAKEWGCYWVLASGSLNRFWELPEFDEDPPSVPELVSKEIRNKLTSYESSRICYRTLEEQLDADRLIDFVGQLPGPRLVILNTVQSAAVAARTYCEKFGRDSVEHISTALTPKDRNKTLKRVKERLVDSNDTNWALFATSCVEAGIDISFRTGVRELCSLMSLLQIAGRVNRHGNITEAEVWTIHLSFSEKSLFKEHPGFKYSSKVLDGIFKLQEEISPDLCTRALKREIRLVDTILKTLCDNEKNMRFPQVEEDFKVIESDTKNVVVDIDLIQRLEQDKRVDWKEVQENSVQVWGYRLNSLRIPEVLGRPGIYKWNLEYDDFLGYMVGLLKIEFLLNGENGAIIL